VELRKSLGSIRRVAEVLGQPFETIRGLVERMEGKELLEELGVEVIDKGGRTSKEGVKKTHAQKLLQAVKRFKKKMEKGKKEEGKEGKEEAEEKKDDGSTKPDSINIDPLKAVERLEWKPRLFKATKEGPYLHEVLKSPDLLIFGIPHTSPS